MPGPYKANDFWNKVHNTGRCHANTQKDRRCRHAAMHNHHLCSVHGLHRKYYIQIQQRVSYDPNGKYEKSDWRAWRKFSVWPVLFNSAEEARQALHGCFTFENLPGRQLSARVKATKKKFRRPTP